MAAESKDFWVRPPSGRMGDRHVEIEVECCYEAMRGVAGQALQRPETSQAEIEHQGRINATMPDSLEKPQRPRKPVKPNEASHSRLKKTPCQKQRPQQEESLQRIPASFTQRTARNGAG